MRKEYPDSSADSLQLWRECKATNPILRYLLFDDPVKTVSRTGYNLRRLISPAVRKFAGPGAGCKGKLVYAGPLPSGPKIYAVTHTHNREDVCWSFDFADEQAYLLTNSIYEMMMHFWDGLGLWLAGVILVHPSDKINRNASINKMKRVLELGGNVIVFPEGTFNRTPNLIVQNLYPGIVRLAKETNTLIIPISTGLYDGIDYGYRGEPITVENLSESEAVERLRDCLATQAWQLMESYGKTTRDQLLRGASSEDYWTKYIDDYISTQGFYDYPLEQNARYITKQEKEQQSAFDYNLIPSLNNAFLFDKRLFG